MTAKEFHFKAGMDAAMELVIGLIGDSRNEQFAKPMLLEGLRIVRQTLSALDLAVIDREGLHLEEERLQ